MAIEILDKHRAKLRVYLGSKERGTRKSYSKIVEYSGKKDLQRQYNEFAEKCRQTPVQNATVAEILDAYINSKRIKGIKETTLSGYESCAKRLKAAFGTVKASDLALYQIDDFIVKSITERGNSAKTIMNIISLLSSAYKHAVRTGRVQHNPCEFVELPKREKPEKTILQSGDIDRFVAALDDLDLDLRVCFELALFCGLRRSEIMGLKYRDINIADSALSVSRTRHRKERRDIIQSTKTDGSRRIMGVPDFVMDDINALIKSHIADPDSTTDFLIQFACEPMRPDYAKKKIKAFTAEHGLPDVTLHGLRHTYASMLIASGKFDIAEISAALGHSNITTTLNVYAHMFDSRKKSQERISEFISAKICTFPAPHSNQKTAETLEISAV